MRLLPGPKEGASPAPVGWVRSRTESSGEASGGWELRSTPSPCRSATEKAGLCSLSCRSVSSRAADRLWGEDASFSLVGCSDPRGCGGEGWAEGLGRRTLSLEDGLSLSSLEPEGKADWTRLGDSWAGSTVAAVGPRDNEHRGDRRRPVES